MLEHPPAPWAPKIWTNERQLMNHSAPTSNSTSPERLLRRPEVETITGLSRSAIYQRMLDGTFPRPIRLTLRSVRWPESQVQAWVQEQIAQTQSD